MPNNTAPIEDLSWQSVAKMIDHTNLRPEATPDQIIRLCQEARQFGFGAVIVNGCYVELTYSNLQDSNVKVGTVIGFPLGATFAGVKQFEAVEALQAGASEVDMVMNVGALKAGDQQQVTSEIRAVAEVVHKNNALLKVILETGLLTDEEKVAACQISVAAGTDFVKTSTGFLGTGATVPDVALMRRTVGTKVGVKASGGIRTGKDIRGMIAAGANRIGTSAGVGIIMELRDEAKKRIF